MLSTCVRHFNSSKITGRTNIKLSMVDQHLGESVTKGICDVFVTSLLKDDFFKKIAFLDRGQPFSA